MVVAAVAVVVVVLVAAFGILGAILGNVAHLFAPQYLGRQPYTITII